MEKIRFTPQGRELLRIQDNHFFDKKSGSWGTHDEGLENYLADLGQLERYPGEIEQLITFRTNPVIIDLLASTGFLNDLLNRYLNNSSAKMIAVARWDNRLPFRIEADEKNNIFLRDGDLKLSATWEEIRCQLNGSKADLIFSRGLAGLYFLPTTRDFAHDAITNIYDFLNPIGGNAFLQIPPESAFTDAGTRTSSWIRHMGTIQGMSLDYVPEYVSKVDRGKTYGLLRIERTIANSPKKTIQLVA